MRSLKKIKRIILSRFKKETKEKWIKDRRVICLGCTFNTLNQERVTLKVRILRALSNFYTFITFSERKKLGFCGICGCDLYYSTRENESECSDTPPKWKSIYIPNK